MIYSFTLYERGPGANLLRVQTDNLDQPLNINQDTKLELGSTAKLRTLINYLEIVSDLHKQYVGMSPQQLAAVKTLPDDHLTEWAVKYLGTAQDRSLTAMLQAALQRKYSGSTGESFFTGGGVHHFDNFETWEARPGLHRQRGLPKLGQPGIRPPDARHRLLLPLPRPRRFPRRDQ